MARVRKWQHELLESGIRHLNRHNGYSSFFITIFPMHRQDNRLVHQRTESILMCMQQIDKLGWRGFFGVYPKAMLIRTDDHYLMNFYLL